MVLLRLNRVFNRRKTLVILDLTNHNNFLQLGGIFLILCWSADYCAVQLTEIFSLCLSQCWTFISCRCGMNCLKIFGSVDFLQVNYREEA